MARIHGASHARLQPLEGWTLAVSPEPGVPPQDAAGLKWIPAQVPGTAAHALFAAGAPEPERFALDSKEVWYRCEFGGEPGPAGTRALRLGGLATLCDAWVNGQHALRSENMFLSHAPDVSGLLRGRNELLLRFSPLEAELKKKRPRPRWKAGLVSKQQLRFVRTSLLGRATSWRVPPPVGPYREVALEIRELPLDFEADLRTTLRGDDGVARLELRVLSPSSLRATGGTLRVGDASAEVQPTADGVRAELRVPSVRRWWPATHGEPALHPASVELKLGESAVRLDLGRVGFRTVEIDQSGGGFRLVLNGAPIFARGSCWTDSERLWLPRDECEAQLRAMRDGGMNMVRVSGTFAYTPDFFHALCDELGILVWQEFMFGPLDYPDEPGFLGQVAVEARQVCDRLQASPSLAVLCGGTEGSQQPAMLGLPWQEAQAGVRGALRSACAAQLPAVPFVASSPTGGKLPFHPEEGVSHWFGVGAYLRGVDDVRRSRVRFASECLGFANVPEQRFIDRWLPGNDGPVASQAWKAGVPRDAMEAWDFDDVRDFYAQRLFGIDAGALRARDRERFLASGRVASGEMMSQVFAEFRRAGSECGGGLVWTWRDMWRGAGWGLFDHDGRPKPAFWILRRALAPRAVLLTDEGLNGLALHAVNDRPEPMEAEVGFALYRGAAAISAASRPITVPARGAVRLLADEVLGRFTDSGYAYRFGPPGFEVAVATLRQGGALLSLAAHYPETLPWRPGETGLHAEAAATPGGFELRLTARNHCAFVALELPEGCTPADNYFHLAPGVERAVAIDAPGLRSLRGSAVPLNGYPVSFSAERA